MICSKEGRSPTRYTLLRHDLHHKPDDSHENDTSRHKEPGHPPPSKHTTIGPYVSYDQFKQFEQRYLDQLDRYAQQHN